MKKSEETLNEIELTQAALRDSIIAAKDLADKSEILIQRHRRELKSED